MRCNTLLSDDEMTRYSRQIRLAEVGKEGQEKIKGTSVLVIGAGALGCPVLQYLAAAGTGVIGIVDNDWVDETNLHRQVLYTLKDIGKPKPLAAREKLKLLNPGVTYKIHFLRLDKESAMKVIPDYDIIVDCTDNFAARYLINDACVILNKPIVYGAIHKFTGQIMVLNYHNGPTLRCLYPEPPHPLEVPSCTETGVIGSIAGIIGSMQATEVIKIILEKDEVLSGKLFMIDSLTYSTQIMTFSKVPANSEIKTLGEYEELCLNDNKLINEISVTELRKMLRKNNDITIVDLRENPVKDDIGFETLSIPYYDISKKLDSLIKREMLVFYCNKGIQSMNVINYLQKVHKKEKLYSLVL
jgi:molybdopterin/thiamine biosynthesis adenylyltransferase/rhodanese-related sulfurtransferase